MREYRPFKTVRPYLRGTDGRLARLAREPVVEGVEHHALRVRRSTTILTAAKQNQAYSKALIALAQTEITPCEFAGSLCGVNAGDRMAGIGLAGAGPDASASPFASSRKPAEPASRSCEARALFLV